jgi:hypothetical protein
MRSYLRWFCIVQCMIKSWPGQFRRHSDLLRLWRSEIETPVGSRFSAPIQSSPVPRAPISSKLGYKVSCLGVRRPESVVDHTSPHSAEVKERVEVYLYSPSELLWLVLVWTAALNWKCSSIHCARINCFFLFVGSTYWCYLRKLLSYSMQRTEVSKNQTASIFSVTKATHSFNKLVAVFYQSTWQNIPGKISKFLPSACRKKAVSHTSYPRTSKALWYKDVGTYHQFKH